MEVHAHTHTPRKKWTHYFWEFLMLFLAVFCGFLAENFREHQIENRREKQYIKTLIEDLTDDIALIDNQVLIQKKVVIQMDSLIELLGSKLSIHDNTNQLYFFGRIAPRAVRFFNNDRTIEQMKSSGGFRLIQNPEVSKRIMSYYRGVDFVKFLEKREDDEQVTYKNLSAKIFDPVIFKNMLSGGDIHRIESSPPLLTYNHALLKELAGSIQYMNGTRNGAIIMKQGIRKNGAELIIFLKKEYHLK